MLEPAQGAVDFIFRMLADAARVEEDRIGLAQRMHQLVAGLHQIGGHQLAIEHVHLATDGLDVHAVGHFSGGRGEKKDEV